MNDRELLEKAAKAAGIVGRWMNVWGEVGIAPDHPDGGMWNPLESDGDALRLAVKLGMDLSLWGTDVFAKKGSKALAQQGSGSDRYAATRRAIVRAAAAIADQEKDE